VELTLANRGITGSIAQYDATLLALIVIIAIIAVVIITTTRALAAATIL